MIKSILNYLKDNVIIVIIAVALFIMIILSNILSCDMNKHIEKVSKKCASQGYGIKAYYTKDGDKFYKCDIGGEFDDK